MSAVELRDLVAQLQVDLVDAVKEKKALQEELKAVPKRVWSSIYYLLFVSVIDLPFIHFLCILCRFFFLDTVKYLSLKSFCLI